MFSQAKSTTTYQVIDDEHLVTCIELRNVPSGEERGETDVFAGYGALSGFSLLFTLDS